MFDTYIAIDWSAKSKPTSQKPEKDSIWLAIKRKRIKTYYFRTRDNCKKFLIDYLLKTDERVLVGFDFCFSFPKEFLNFLGLKDWKDIWFKIDNLIIDRPDNSNNRFEAANKLNKNGGPFYGRPKNLELNNLNRHSPGYPFKGIPNIRETEKGLKVQPVWKLIGVGSVGGQSLLGIKALKQLRFDILEKSRVWPCENIKDAKVVFAEIWPGLIKEKLKDKQIKDKEQVIETLKFMEKQKISDKKGIAKKEGWILGV